MLSKIRFGAADTPRKIAIPPLALQCAKYCVPRNFVDTFYRLEAKHVAADIPIVVMSCSAMARCGHGREALLHKYVTLSSSQCHECHVSLSHFREIANRSMVLSQFTNNQTHRSFDGMDPSCWLGWWRRRMSPE